MDKPIKRYPIKKMLNFRDCGNYIDENYDVNIRDFWIYYMSEKYMDYCGGEDGGVISLYAYDSPDPNRPNTNNVLTALFKEFGEGEGRLRHITFWVEID